MYYEPHSDLGRKLISTRYENSLADLHFHKSVEIIYVEKGCLEVKSGKDCARFKAGEMAFIQSFVGHTVIPLENSSSITLLFPENFFSFFTKNDIQLDYFKLDNLEINKKIYSYILDSITTGNKYNFIKMQGYANIILGEITEKYPPSKNTSGDRALKLSITEYINNNFKNNITLDSISKHFGYNKYYFSKLFNVFFGCNLNFFVNYIRINYISEQICKERTLSDLVLDSGFKDLSTYYRFRKKIT